MPSARSMCAITALIIFGAMAGGAVVAGWVFVHDDARLPLRNQPVTVRFPAPLAIRARVDNDLDILMDGKLHAQVPVDQTLHIPIRDTLHVTVDFDHDVPIHLTVPIHQSIPVDQTVHVDSHVKVTVLGQALTLPVHGDIPIKTEVPLDLDVPVDQSVHLKFSAPTAVKLKQALAVPLKTTIDTTIPLHSEMKVPVKSELQANVIVDQPVHAVITESDLDIPLHTLRLVPASASSAQ